jgi:hypothetical protein
MEEGDLYLGENCYFVRILVVRLDPLKQSIVLVSFRRNPSWLSLPLLQRREHQQLCKRRVNILHSQSPLLNVCQAVQQTERLRLVQNSMLKIVQWLTIPAAVKHRFQQLHH